MDINKIVKPMGFAAIIFGVATVFSGGQALFGGQEARESVGEAVPFVLGFNFLAGFLYVLAGIGLLMKQRWSVPVSVFLLASTVTVFAAFGIHVMGGGGYESRTVAAMTLRTLFWGAATIISIRAFGCFLNRCLTPTD